MHWTESYTFMEADYNITNLLEDYLSGDAVAYFSNGAVYDVEHLPDSWGIYAVIDLLTRSVYVGRGNIRRRARAHFSELKRGRPSNFLMRRLIEKEGTAKFVIVALQVYPDDGDRLWRHRLRNLELQWAVTLMAYDEERGFNLEAGNVRTPGSRFRECERRLIKKSHYYYLRGRDVHPYDPIPTPLLKSWVRGVSVPDGYLGHAF